MVWQVSRRDLSDGGERWDGEERYVYGGLYVKVKKIDNIGGMNFENSIFPSFTYIKLKLYSFMQAFCHHVEF